MKLEGKYWLVLFPKGPHIDLDGEYELHPDERGDAEAPYSNDEGCVQFHVEIRMTDGYLVLEVIE